MTKVATMMKITRKTMAANVTAPMTPPMMASTLLAVGERKY